MFVLWFLLCSFSPPPPKKKKKTALFFPTSIMPLSTMLWSHAVMYPEQVTFAQCITIGIHLILVKAMWPRMNQWQSLFTWVKVYKYHNIICFILQVNIIIPIGMLLASIYLVVAPITTDPWGSLIALAIIVAGLPFYWLFIYSDKAPKFILNAAGKTQILRGYLTLTLTLNILLRKTTCSQLKCCLKPLCSLLAF